MLFGYMLYINICLLPLPMFSLNFDFHLALQLAYSSLILCVFDTKRFAVKSCVLLLLTTSYISHVGVSPPPLPCLSEFVCLFSLATCVNVSYCFHIVALCRLSGKNSSKYRPHSRASNREPKEACNQLSLLPLTATPPSPRTMCKIYYAAKVFSRITAINLASAVSTRQISDTRHARKGKRGRGKV